MTLFVQAPTGSLKYTFEWADSIPANVDLVSVSYVIPSDWTLVSQVTDTDNATSTIQLSGIAHGSLGIVTATALLTNSEEVPDQQLVIRGFNG
jgi:hypothetical protein